MNWLVYEKESGIVVGHIVSETKPVVLNHHSAFHYHEEKIPDFNTVIVQDGVLVHKVSSEYLESVKRQAEVKTNRTRNQAIENGMKTSWGVVQVDQQSSVNINSAVSRALIDGEKFQIDWRTSDNQLVTLDAKSMIEMGRAASQFVNDIYAHSWKIKEMIQKATTLEEISAVEIDFSEVIDKTDSKG